MSPWRRCFLHGRTGARSTSLQEIYRQCSPDERQLSPEFFRVYPAGRGTGALTPFVGILQEAGPLAGGDALVRRPDRALEPVPGAAKTTELAARLNRALLASLPDKEVAVAVSGGVDSWLLAALLREQGYRVQGWYLHTGIPGYCEHEQVERSAKALGIECRSIRASADDFNEAAAAFVAVTQSPIYNLHPLSKWLLAKGLRSAGVTTVVTGDAADQVMRWDWDCDLLPLTMACFQGAKVRLVMPFMADEVVAFCRRPEAEKQPVRDLARRLGVPVVAKQPTMLPVLPLPAQPRASLPAAEPGTAAASPERTACLAYTTGLLQQWVEGTSQ